MRGVRVLVALTLMLSACSTVVEQIAEQGEGVENVEIQTEDDGVTVEIETEEGDATISGGTDLPSDFPFPIPEGFTVVGSAEIETPDGKSFTGVLSGPADSFDDAVSYYEQFLQGQGFEVDRIESYGGGFNTVTLGGMKDGLVASATIGSSGGETSISLGWGPG